MARIVQMRNVDVGEAAQGAYQAWSTNFSKLKRIRLFRYYLDLQVFTPSQCLV